MGCFFFTFVRQQVNKLVISVVVHELEFAMKRALSDLLGSYGNQYNVGRFSWFFFDTLCKLCSEMMRSASECHLDILEVEFSIA